MTLLLYGTNDYVIHRKIDKIKETNHITSDDITYYDYQQTLMKPIIEDALLLPLFNENKLIIVDNCNLFESSAKKEEVSSLEQYLKNENKNTILVFIDKTDKLDERKKIVKILKENNSITVCNELNITELAKEQLKGYHIDNTTITNLINRVGNNPYNLINEIEKLKIFKINDKVITDKDIQFTSKNIEDGIFDLIDYVINKNNEKIVEVYNDLLLKNSEPIAILILIANQFRLMLQCKKLYYQGYSEKDIASLLEVHPYRVKLALQKSKSYSDETLITYLEQLANLDYEIKSGAKEASTSLELFLLGVLKS